MTVPLALWAVRVAETVPLEPTGAVPEMVAVPFPLSFRISHLGRVPLALMVGVGDPVVVTVKLALPPRATSSSPGEVMAGGDTTLRVNFWVTVTPSASQVMVMG